MWGAQPGVSLNSNGRVAGLSLEGFGASGRVPDAIGQTHRAGSPGVRLAWGEGKRETVRPQRHFGEYE